LLEKLWRSIHLGAGFLFLFCAYNTVQSLLTSLFAELGLHALIIVNGGFAISTIFSSYILSIAGIRCAVQL